MLYPRAVSEPAVLAQEGWHYEPAEPAAAAGGDGADAAACASDDAAAPAAPPLAYKGVVYNEMKGVYSSPDSLMGRTTQQALFPDNTYGVDSGGDPLAIPTLTFDAFKGFHERFYHPSNARVYFYGDDDPYERLELLDSYLKDFDAIEPDSAIVTQRKKREPWRVVDRFARDDEAEAAAAAGGDAAAEPKQHMLAVNWLLNEEASERESAPRARARVHPPPPPLALRRERAPALPCLTPPTPLPPLLARAALAPARGQPFTAKEQLALAVLDHLLMGTSAATLQKALVDSALGASVIGGGLSDELKQATFSAGLKGVAAGDVDKVRAPRARSALGAARAPSLSLGGYEAQAPFAVSSLALSPLARSRSRSRRSCSTRCARARAAASPPTRSRRA